MSKHKKKPVNIINHNVSENVNQNINQSFNQNIVKKYAAAINITKQYNRQITTINNITIKAAKAEEKNEKQLTKVQKVMSGMGKLGSKAMSMVSSSAVKLGSKLNSSLIASCKRGLQVATDLEDAQKSVSAAFGTNADEINTWAKNTSKNYGLSELQAKQFSSSMGEVLKTTGLPSGNILKMSKNLTQLTGDFSSFYNISQDDAFKKIQSAVSGDGGALKDLGINMSEANLQSYALSKGIKVSYNQMNEASKAQLRYDYLMANTRKAQNNFSSSSGNFSNQIKLLKINFDQLKGNLMSAVLPSFSKCLKAVNDFMNGLNNSEAIKKIQGAIVVLFDKISTVLPNILNLAAQLVPIIANIFEAISKSSILDEISSIVSKIIDSVISYIPTIVKCIESVSGAIKTVINFIVNNWSIIGPILAGVIAAVGMIAVKSILIPNIISGIISAIGGMSRVIGLLSGAIGFLASPFGIAVLAVGALVAAGVALYENWGTISKGIVAVWQNYVMPFFNGVVGWFAGIGTAIATGFKGVVNTFIDGINVLIGALDSIQVHIPDWVPYIGGKGFQLKIPLVPKFADGGIANRPSIFGEAGPEMAIPLKPTARNIGLLNQTAQVLGVKQGDGGPNVTINLTINSADGNPRTIAGAAEDAIVGVIEKYFGDKARVAYGQ